MAYATTDDVETYLMRPLSNEEKAAALAYLGIIELVIRRETPNFATEVTTNVDFAEAVTYVEGALVADILRNPDRFQYEQAGDYAYSLQKVLQADSLREAISTDMWWLLGVNKTGAFTIETAVFADGDRRLPRWWSTIERGI